MLEKIKYAYRSLMPKSLRRIIRSWIVENKFHYDAEIEFYGAYEVLRQNLKVKKLTYPQRRNINWAHGWYSDFFMLYSQDPYFANCNIYYKVPGRVNFVTRKSQEQFLRDKGYPNSFAIGMPITYIPEKRVIKRKSSLLVVPTHTMDGYEINTFEEEYAILIDSFKNDFDEIVVMIHPTCFKNDKWVNTFRRHSYKIIKGVRMESSNSFYRLRNIMSRFEFVTTNAFGSHMMYAAYFGAKVSIIGREMEHDPNEIEKDDNVRLAQDKSPFYESLRIVSTVNYRKHYPEFYVNHPRQAILQKEMADRELGVDCRVSKERFDELVAQYVVPLEFNIP